MIRKLVSFFRDTVGAIAPLTAVMLPLLLGAAGVGVDVSVWLQQQRDLQTAADAAAIAAAWEIANNQTESDATAVALKEVQNNGYSDATASDVTVSFSDVDDTTEVNVTLTEQSTRFLAINLMSAGDPILEVTATATLSSANPAGGFCMLSLAETGTSMLFNGNITIDSPTCGLAVNSNDPNAALNINGNSGSYTVADVSVVGGIDDGDLLVADSITEGASPAADPYSDLSIPSYASCSEADQGNRLRADDMADLPSPDANGVTVICGELEIQNNDSLTLDPGIYVIDGGDLDVKGELFGDDVTIILTNSGADSYGEYGDVQISGTIDISSPSADTLDDDWDEFEGVAVYQDRNAPAQVQCNDIRGANSDYTVFSGAFYTPSRCIDIGGGSNVSGTDVCSRLIGLTITIHGNPNMNNDCTNSEAEDITAGGTPSVRLSL